MAKNANEIPCNASHRGPGEELGPLQNIERVSECVWVFCSPCPLGLWGPVPVETKGQRRCYITLRMTPPGSRISTSFAKNLRISHPTRTTYEAWCATQLGACLKVLHSNRGGKYLGKEFILYLKKRHGTETYCS